MAKFKVGDHIFNKNTKESYTIQHANDETYVLKEKPGYILTKFIDDDFGLIRGNVDRFNDEQLDLTRCPIGIRAAISAVYQYECVKFDQKNVYDEWRNGDSWTKVLNQIYKHLANFEIGLDEHPKDGLDPLWHAAAELAKLIEYKQSYKQGDDRFKKQSVSCFHAEKKLQDAIAELRNE